MIINVDCFNWMQSQPDNSIDCIVCDPPYSLGFMGKHWDQSLPSIQIWQEALRISKPGTWLLAFGGTRTYHRLTCSIEDAGWEIRDCIMWLYGSGFPKGKGQLKPAYEPVILARKKAPGPLLNIDDCRIEGKPRTTHSDGNYKGHDKDASIYNLGLKEGHFTEGAKGRWPANLILDEEARSILDEQSGILKSGKVKPYKRSMNDQYSGSFPDNINEFEPSSGGASRFFYCAKASTSERNGSTHPTMKPIRLMEYLIKLVMPKEGILLDPFAGSGTTILAAQNLGYNAIGIEKEKEYCEIAEARLKIDKQMKLDLK